MSSLSRGRALSTVLNGRLGSSTSIANTQHGRAAAYRRSIANSLFSSSNDIISFTPSLTSTSTQLRSFSIAAPRSVSFRELREARAAERRGETPPSSKEQRSSPSSEKASSSSAAKSSPSQESTPTPNRESQNEPSEAEEVYARIRAQNIKEERQYQASQEKEADGKTDESEGTSEEKKDTPPPPPPPQPQHGNKTPWQVFSDTLQTEFKASKEWNEGTKQLAGSVNDFTQNPNVQKARTAYTKAADTAANASSAALKKSATAIGQGAAWTWDTNVVKGVRAGANAVGSGIEKVTRPVRETEAFKNVKDVIDDGSSSRYGGWTEKEERRRKREIRELKEGKRKVEKMEEDTEAGTNITLHKDAAWKESWNSFKDNSKLMQGLFNLKSSYAESENPFVSTARSISDRVAGFFAENETARVIKKFREMDPSFQIEPFVQELREYILPEVLDAYVKGDVETLKLWLSAAQFQVYAALMKQYTQHGLQSDGKILDIRNVDILNSRMLEPGEIPVFIITCRTQEVHVYRNKKSGELASGMEDKVQQVTYAIGVTRVPEDVNNPETRGWRLIEMQKSGRDYI